ncbi:glycoside hydrolase family 16 protein [Chitinilyticum piscinae]|uniref:Glycoside hydrolase family 16 protein n=1 Tax=Chitinilyticum piscinae TaxID=2866724 RepID=A0A8J7FH80_9NEIS|nr:glycoside hydrolase family 16 protein [Chitinilyticum piscinae]MBE9608145.1 glycoside hydrolase family 16 protein [Chitinilyticum piscinae]
MKTAMVVLLLGSLLQAGCQNKTAPATTSAGGVLFDDFSHASLAEMQQHGWIIRMAAGWPGVEHAGWGEAAFSLHDDPARPGNRLLRMTAQTDGTAAGTRQAQFCHARKYLAGTYAARVRFSDAPVRGPNGDQVVQTFYTISPLERDLDPQYSELDHEYLPNGGWGAPAATLFNTSWETVRLVPWQAFNQHAWRPGSLAGWHVLLIQVGDGKIDYWLDDDHLAQHDGKVYPRVPMSLNFNLWFTREGLLPAGEMRVWEQDIDWVYHASGRTLSTAEVLAEVEALRRAQVRSRDSIAATGLSSPCAM